MFDRTTYKGTNGRPAMQQVTVNPKPRTSGYMSLASQYQQRPRDLPPLGFDMVRSMLLDPAVRLGLAMRTAPLCGMEIAYNGGQGPDGKPKWVPGVLAKRPEVGEFVRRQLARIWSHGIDHVLTAQVWGWSAGEIMYRVTSRGTVEVDYLLGRHATDTRALIDDGCVVGVRVLRVTKESGGHVDLKFPKCWFHAYNPEAGAFYGQTVLMGAYSPWADKAFHGGATDVRRLFMHKDAYGGVDMTYPDGVTTIGNDEVANRDIALQIAEQIQSGGVTSRPAAFDQNGNELWKLTRAAVPGNPQHILQFPKDLDTEIFHGLEIPDDVIESENTGAWAGKRIPMAAFYNSLDIWLTCLLGDLTEQVLEPLVLLNFGRAEEFAVSHKPLGQQAMEQQGDSGEGQTSGQQQQGQQQPGGNPLQQFQGSRPQQPGQLDQPHQRMGLDPVMAVGEGVLNAAELVRAAREVLRLPRDSVRMAASHAPAGGISVAGQQFKDGEFIPSDVVAQATDEEQRQLAGGKPPSQGKPKNAKQATAEAKFAALLATKTPQDRQAFERARADGVAIPPAWTQVTYHGKDQNILAEGRDDKGRKQRAENPEYRQRISDANNARITTELRPRMAALRQQLRKDAESGNEEAKVLYLISLTGFRIGGKGDGKAKQQAFGASTLMGDHVKVDGNTVTFDFPGKKGVRQQHAINDPIVAAMMKDAKPGQPVFATRDVKVREAWQSKYGGEKVHDIRHVVASEIAEKELAKRVPPPPKNDKQRKAMIKEVATIAAHTLGNDPAQTLGTYIDPQLWSKVQVAA